VNQPPPILKYNPNKNMFFLEGCGMLPAKIFGSTLVRLPSGGSLWALPAWYPNGYLAVKDYKALYPEGKISQEALGKIKTLTRDQTSSLIPEGYQFSLPPYLHQTSTLELMLRSHSLALLLEMGLGKTFISINYVSIKKILSASERFRTLVVAPKRMLDNWAIEIEEYTTNLRYLIYRGTLKKRKKLREEIQDTHPDVILTNYEGITPKKASGSEDFLFFRNYPFDCLIIDEASRIKGHDSTRSEAIMNIGGKIQHKFILSGTITLGNPLDLYTPFSLLDQAIFGSNFYRFKNKHCRFSPYNKHIVIGYKNMDLLKSQIDPFSVIINKKDCLTLPEQTFGRHWYRLTEEQRTLYNQIVTQETVKVGGKDVPVSMAMTKINKMMQVLSGFIVLPPDRENLLCGECKEHLLECIKANIFPWDKKCQVPNTLVRPKREYHHLKEIPKLELLREDMLSLPETTRVCIWAFYQQDVVNIHNMLEEEKIHHVVFDRPGRDREFQKDLSIKAFVGQISTGIGITLTGATMTIYYSHSLKLDDRLQSIDRNYRIGQREKVQVFDYCGRGSIEDSVISLLSQKQDVRDFIHQSKNVCVECGPDKMGWCQARGILPYSKKCKLNEVREGVETARHLLIDTIDN